MDAMPLPEPTHTPLRGGPVLRWGVLAPGTIAEAWTSSLHRFTDQRVAAVASRTPARAQAFAARHGIPRAHGGYEALLADPDVDAVYVAAPHSEHLPLALLALDAGKHVLVEKPAGLNADQARVLAGAARRTGRFAQEAMWSRFLPQTTVLDRLVRDGALGDVLAVTADFGELFPTDPEGRAYNPALGGGALLDVGVYPIWFARFVLGAPDRVTATGSMTTTGVDAQVALVLDYASRAQAVLTTSMLVATPLRAVVAGTAARVEYTGPYLAPSGFVVRSGDRVLAEYRDPNGLAWHDGLCYQAEAMAAHVAEGRAQSPLHSLADTVGVLEIVDAAAAQVAAR